MTIPLKQEEFDMYENMGVFERCHFCQKPTSYWHENTNNAVCQKCAKLHKVAELPDYGHLIRAKKRNKRA